jgi:glutaredoxin/glutathione-dependent peroxiredoxin
MRTFIMSAMKKIKTTPTQTRSITIGTDLKPISHTWQKARPWYMTDADGSNLAKDNARSMENIFKGRTVAVFGVPAPFTGTCSNEHYPPYKAAADEFLAEGVDELICYSVADPYSHHNWGKDLKNDFDKISFAADVDCDWATEFELNRDYSGASLGHRSARFSMLVKDGVVKAFNLVDDATKDAEVLLADVKANK